MSLTPKEIKQLERLKILHLKQNLTPKELAEYRALQAQLSSILPI